MRVAAALVVIALLAACSGGTKHVATTQQSASSTSTTIRRVRKPAKHKAKPKPKATTTTQAPTTVAPATFPPATFPPAAPTQPPPPTPTTLAGNLGAVKIALAPVVSGLTSPVAIAFRKNDPRMYVAEQNGHVRVIANGHIVGTALTVAVSGGNEQGLLGIAFSNDGTKLYADYTDPHGDSHVDDYTMSGTTATAKRQLLFQTQPYANHNGGEVLVDSNGYLYIGFGDGGSAGDPQGNGQNLNTWLGKILRIDPRKNGASPYSIPLGNPYVARLGIKPEIWMYGLRNPWRFSIDRVSHDMWIGDVGQDAYEEVDYAAAGTRGQNWGWNAREGFHAYSGGSAPNAQNPILEETHTNGWCAIIGGYVYRGSAIPLLYGTYLYADNCRPQIVAVVRRGAGIASRREFNGPGALTSFGEGLSSELYVASRNGTIYEIVKG
jgi:glucose/arabinose dehydrogenase